MSSDIEFKNYLTSRKQPSLNLQKEISEAITAHTLSKSKTKLPEFKKNSKLLEKN